MKDYTAIFFISAIDDFVFLSLLLKDILVLNDAKASRVPDEERITCTVLYKTNVIIFRKEDTIQL